MTVGWDPQHLEFARSHLWAVLATGRADGSPQQSMIGYLIDDEGRLVISAQAYTAEFPRYLSARKLIEAGSRVG